jgi:ATP-binding cassette subfamily C protein CydD
MILIAQAGLLASIIHQLVIEQVDKQLLIPQFFGLILTVIGRAVCSWGREVAGYRAGEQIRIYIRQLIIDKLQTLGPAYIKGKPAGAWATLLLEQVEDMQDFFSRYLPQMSLSVLIPLVILVVVFPTNWAAGLIFLITAPLVPLFMALAGIKASEANRKNFKALQRLSGHFYDRLQSMTTIRLFNRTQAEQQTLYGASEVFRVRTMDVLKIAFLSSAVLEFFTSISIAITAVYFGFSYIGELDFGYYGTGVTLFSGLFVLILAPEFYQPLRDLGTFYHAKAQAVGAAESIITFLEADISKLEQGNELISNPNEIEIEADNLIVKSPEGKVLVGPLSFRIHANQTTALIGPSGSGKTSLINAILGFLPYQGHLKVNGIELKQCQLAHWREQISWVGQNPLILHGTIKENVTLGNQNASQQQIDNALSASFSQQFVDQHGLDYLISDRSGGLSVGQAQRLALARAMLQNGAMWILDEPTASLDATSEQLVMQGIESQISHRTSLLITHQLKQLEHVAQILVLDSGQLIAAGSYTELQQQAVTAELFNSHLSNEKGEHDA